MNGPSVSPASMEGKVSFRPTDSLYDAVVTEPKPHALTARTVASFVGCALSSSREL